MILEDNIDMSEKYTHYVEYAKKMNVIDIDQGVDGERYSLSEGFKRELLQVVQEINDGGRLSAISTFPENEIDRAIILMALVRHSGVVIDPEVCCATLFIESMIRATIDRELRLIGGELI